MLRIIKNRPRQMPKLYLGVIGSYMIEILDDHPLIRKITTKLQFHELSKPQLGSRLGGPCGRMILKGFTDDVLIVIRTKKRCKNNDTCVLGLMKNKSDIPSKVLLQDARSLAILRWRNVQF